MLAFNYEEFKNPHFFIQFTGNLSIKKSESELIYFNRTNIFKNPTIIYIVQIVLTFTMRSSLDPGA